jgi:hypothetical protein
MARVNGVYRENLDATRRQQLIEELRSGASNGRAH